MSELGRSAPDLLFDPPLLVSGRAKEAALRETLTFGFARGAERDRLLLVTEPPLGESHFEKSAFSSDLFLNELVERSFKLVAGGKAIESKARYFTKLITHPPKERCCVDYRNSIHEELSDSPQRLTGLVAAYLATVDFRDALCGTEFNQRSVGVRRRIDILMAYRKAIEQLHRACGTSVSGLSRVATWIEDIQTKPAHQALLQLLDFEGGRSVLETRLQAGYDGTLRRFEIVRVSTVQHRAFPRGPLTRLFRSLVSLLKGYRFSEEDVMSHVLDDVFAQLEDEVTIVLGLMQQIEFYLRAAYFCEQAKAKGFSTCVPVFVSAGHGRTIQGLFNPWLLSQKGETPVPCQIHTEAGEAIVIVTGPNSGGKTRLLQSLASAQLLAQAGLPVPAQSAELLWVEQLFLSLIEHVASNQVEGRLGSELLRIRQVFETSGERALILMDELCSGTNPSEGERIFEMVLELLKELGAQVWITTHFLDFALRIQEKQEDGALAFLQVELDQHKRPTYQFISGVAETSLARNTAARLGVTREELRALILSHADRHRLT